MFNPIDASQNIKDEFSGYISTSFKLADKDYARQFSEALTEEGTVAKGPYLDIGDSFKVGKSLCDLIDDGTVARSFCDLEGNIPDGEKEIKIERKLYLHQQKAVEKTNAGKNLVVTTGTGSGKTECFIIPIINHLLKEKEAGTLNDGVRAILIYPMNALANDQMKRLRATLKSFPEITFGVYNSSTEQKEKNGIIEYGKIFKDELGRPLKPLPNEAISRDTMQEKPPHILVTNYAMLEYMMLRPNDDKVFSGANLRFLVLDEAHIYRGATGIETSLLLRRLKARIADPNKVIHILTSATLGGEEANRDIVAFAKRLCEADFSEEDIIRSETQAPDFPDDEIDVPLEAYAELASPETSLNEILNKYGIAFDETKSDSEIIYDLCIRSKEYRILRKCVDKPMTLGDITSRMKDYIEVEEKDVVNLINVAVQADRNKTALIKARYHMFVRALEGGFLTLAPTKRFFLKRNSLYTTDQEEWKIFEAAVCDDCGRMGIVGKTINSRLEFAGDRFDENAEFYLIAEKDEELIDDEDNGVDSEEIGKNDFLICPKCGEIHHKSLAYDFKCKDDKSKLISVVLAERKGSRNEPKCPCCNFGHLKSFYLGYDAATAVLGTSLFEQLPENEVKLETRKVENNASTSLFAPASQGPSQLDIRRKERQFLAFSDSRGEAAFYACYMTSYYEEFLRRRGIWNVVKTHAAGMSKHPWEISTLIEELTSYFDTNRSFAAPGDRGTENLTPISQRQAWIAVLNEMVNARRSTSLVSLGVIKFEYKGNTGPIMAGVAQKYNQSVDDMVALFNLLVMDIVYSGAIEGGSTLTNDDREYIYYTSKPRRFTKCKQASSEGNFNYLTGWIPRTRTNGSLFSNARVKRVVNSLNITEKEAKSLLEDYWNSVLTQGEFALTPTGDGEYYISTDRFIVSSGTEDNPIYVCDKCGKTTMFSDKNKCISIKCDGHLRKVSHDELISDNHFAKLYSSEMMKPLHIKEHTAQLGREEQQDYQELFVKKAINALSCSTTFEMGVDVGDLETVYLRNMPPSPANYVQRAGRAGRSLHTAAYSLTYSKLSSHDFTYFDKPERMITGEIGVPMFSIENEKVVARHIYAVALSMFFGQNEDVYNHNDADVFLNEDGFERFVTFIDSNPNELKEILSKSIPEDLHDSMGIRDFGWKERLIGEDGVLTVAVKEFREIVEYYEKEIRRLKRSDMQEAARMEIKLWNFRKSKEDKVKSHNELIEFLVRNNVLPQYGFPVDTVELHQNMNSRDEKKLQMVRDLQLAVSEYAPAAQVVADGKLYTSRYIRRLPQTTGQNWETVYISQCANPSCKTWNHRITEPSREGEYCVSCGDLIEKPKWKKAIEPRKGFIAEPNPTDVPLRKPDRSYRSDDYYLGDLQRKVILKRTYQVEGTNKYQMETSTNDSLMVVCNDDFYVCDKCGYSESLTENSSRRDFNPYSLFIERPNHSTPWNRKCSGRLNKSKLCHSFKTDVVRIVFGSNRAKNKATMLSAMYALLEAASSELEIERTDIKGCLHKIRYEGSMIYSVILYDSVAGGAGHVRRMVTEDSAVFQRIVKKAIDITENCTCNPSCYNCLRNYYNQKIHDLLNREAACSFLKNYYGAVVEIDEGEFEKQRIKPSGVYNEDQLIIRESYSCASYRDWIDLAGTMAPGEYYELFSTFDGRVPLPTEAYQVMTFVGTGIETEALFTWAENKIIVFDDESEKVELQGWNTFYCRDINTNEFAALF